MLNDVWKESGCHRKWMRIQLHYVQGKVHVDVYLPLTCIDAEHGADEIIERFTRPAERLPDFDRVCVYFVSQQEAKLSR